MQKAHLFLAFLVGCILCFAIGYPVGYRNGVASVDVEVLPPDTVTITKTVRDTEYVPEPYPVYSEVIRTEYLPAKIDSAEIDVPVPIEQKRYENKDFTAWVSGYKPELDSIWIFPETKYVQTVITETSVIKEEYSRWSLSVQGGYGITPQGALTPYIGLGVSYNLWSPKRKTKVKPPP